MNNYARIIENTAIDVSRDPENEFFKDVAMEFVAVPIYVSHGWKLINQEWHSPAEDLSL